LTWFGMTHELVTTGFGAHWRMAWLPGMGGVGDQDARLLEGLTLARAVSQAALAEELHGQRERRRRQE
jgi:hypothetical protein